MATGKKTQFVTQDYTATQDQDWFDLLNNDPLFIFLALVNKAKCVWF